MKVAVCLYGQPRYFKKGYPFFKEAFANVEVDYFIHSWYDENIIGQELIPGSNPSIHSRGWKVEAETDKQLLKLFQPKKYIIEKPKKFVPKLDFSSNMKTKQKPEDFMSMMYSRKAVGLLLEEYVNETSIEYDWVVFSRTDVAIKRPMLQELKRFPRDTVLTAHAPGEIWNVTHNNDAIIASNYETMMYWSKLYDLYEHYWMSGIAFCAHRLQHYHLSRREVKLEQILEPQGAGWGWIRNEGIVCY